MALAQTKKVRYAINERLDLPDKLAEDTLRDETDGENRKQLVVGEDDGRVFRGFTTPVVAGPNLGWSFDSAESVAVDRNGHVLLATGAVVAALTDSLATNTINYIHVYYDDDDSDAETRRVYSGGAEISDVIDTRLTRTVKLYRTTVAYGAGTPDLADFTTNTVIGGSNRQLIPLYGVAVNAGDTITAVSDFRPLWSVDNANDYSASSPDFPHDFTPTDGDTLNMLDVRSSLVAIIDRLKQLKGTTNWWDDSSQTLESVAGEWIIAGSNVYRGTGNVGVGLNPTSADFEVRTDTDATALIGRARIGFDGSTADRATFTHLDQPTTGHALSQGAGGTTYLNCATSASILFRVNSVTQWALQSDGDLAAIVAGVQLLIDDGAVGAPGLGINGDESTGIYSPSAGVVGVSLTGTEKMRVSGSGARFSTNSAGTNYVSVGHGGSNGWVDRVGVGSLLLRIDSVTQWTIDNAGNLFPASGNVLSFDDGVVGTPGLSVLGDGDTGFYAPAGDTLAMVTGGTEAFRIDTSQRVGIGRTPTTNTLEVDASFSLHGPTGTTTMTGFEIDLDRAGINYIRATNAAGSLYFATGGVSQWFIDSDGHFTAFTTSEQIRAGRGTAALPGYSFKTNTNTGISAQIDNVMVFSTNGSGRWTMDASGNLESLSTGQIRATPGTAALPGIAFNGGDTNTGISAQTDDIMILSTAGLEALRIDSSQRVGIGRTPAANNLEVDTALSVHGTWVATLVSNDLSFSRDGLNYITASDASGSLVFRTGGLVSRWRINTAGDFVSQGAFQILADPGTTGAPGLSFNGDSNTGWSAATADNLIASTAAVGRLKIAVGDGTGARVTIGQPTATGATSYLDIIGHQTGANQVGVISFLNTDTGSQYTGAQIVSSNEGTDAGNFQFKLFNGSTLTTRMTISSDGRTVITSTSGGDDFSVNGNADSTVAAIGRSRLGSSVASDTAFFSHYDHTADAAIEQNASGTTTLKAALGQGIDIATNSGGVDWSFTSGGDLAANPGIQLLFDDGSKTEPGLAVNGDTNTGVYSPGANTLALTANGTERLRTAASGIFAGANSDGANYMYLAHTGTAGFIDCVGAGNFQLRVGGTNYITLETATGHIGLGSGATNPGSPLTVEAAGAVSAIVRSSDINGDCAVEVGRGGSGNRLAYIDLVGDDTYTNYGCRLMRQNSGANSESQLLHRGTGNLSILTDEAAPIVLSTNSITRLQVASGGQVSVGSTFETTARFNVFVQAGSGYAAYFHNAGNNTNRRGLLVECGNDTPTATQIRAIDFNDNDGGDAGGVQWNNGGASFRAPSDARIKSNIAPTKVEALPLLGLLRLKEFKKIKASISSEKLYSNPTLNPIGWIAQEVEDIFPEMVSENEVDGTKSVGDTKLIPYLVKAVQELTAELRTAQAHIENLEKAIT